ncbi:hypothetical protein K402DRAFT_427303 [Aulographum hederae CBS 113979]|uniref:Uncharacterized protein n=1 Tax=Aulographum hederae CBS 113979 TaxID=1176131 RepID=A0A6G1H6M5_9PEZI|nr:hypothetical protein K402DRAFT_427303 [Aulographum hederae CBS 113979]
MSSPSSIPQTNSPSAADTDNAWDFTTTHSVCVRLEQLRETEDSWEDRNRDIASLYHSLIWKTRFEPHAASEADCELLDRLFNNPVPRAQESWYKLWERTLRDYRRVCKLLHKPDSLYKAENRYEKLFTRVTEVSIQLNKLGAKVVDMHTKQVPLLVEWREHRLELRDRHKHEAAERWVRSLPETAVALRNGETIGEVVKRTLSDAEEND